MSTPPDDSVPAPDEGRPRWPRSVYANRHARPRNMSDAAIEDTSAQEIYVARQPIVDVNGQLVGYELLFRSANMETANHDDSVLATSTVIANVFGDMGLGDVIGDVDGYLNVDTDFLFSDLVEA